MPERVAQSLVLASTSPYRRVLLQRLGLEFAVCDPQLPETRLAQEPADHMVQRLSRAKAQAVHRFGTITIGSDQCAVAGSELLGKPESQAAAKVQLSAMSGQLVTFFTGLCVCSGSRQHYYQDATRVQFRQLSAAEIQRYVAREQPLNCAGSFKVEGLGIALFESIESNDPTALQGLPLIALARMLRALNIDLP